MFSLQELRRRRETVMRSFGRQQATFERSHATEIREVAAASEDSDLPRCVVCRQEEQVRLPAFRDAHLAAPEVCEKEKETAVRAAAMRSVGGVLRAGFNPIGLLAHVQLSGVGAAPRCELPSFLLPPLWRQPPLQREWISRELGESPRLKETDGGKEDKEDGAEFAAAPTVLTPWSGFQGVRLSSCGHRMHLQCYFKFCDLHWRQRSSRALSMSCPYCGQPTNILLPEAQPRSLARLEALHLVGGGLDSRMLRPSLRATQKATPLGNYSLRGGTSPLMAPVERLAEDAFWKGLDEQLEKRWMRVSDMAARLRESLEEPRRRKLGPIFQPLKRRQLGVAEILHLSRAVARLSPVHSLSPVLLWQQSPQDAADFAAEESGADGGFSRGRVEAEAAAADVGADFRSGALSEEPHVFTWRTPREEEGDESSRSASLDSEEEDVLLRPSFVHSIAAAVLNSSGSRRRSALDRGPFREACAHPLGVLAKVIADSLDGAEVSSCADGPPDLLELGRWRRRTWNPKP